MVVTSPGTEAYGFVTVIRNEANIKHGQWIVQVSFMQRSDQRHIRYLVCINTQYPIVFCTADALVFIRPVAGPILVEDPASRQVANDGRAIRAVVINNYDIVADQLARIHTRNYRFGFIIGDDNNGYRYHRI